jgi:hypothetical protein
MLELPRGEHLLRVAVGNEQQLHALAFMSATPFALAEERQVGGGGGRLAAAGATGAAGALSRLPVPWHAVRHRSAGSVQAED